MNRLPGSHAALYMIAVLFTGVATFGLRAQEPEPGVADTVVPLPADSLGPAVKDTVAPGVPDTVALAAPDTLPPLPDTLGRAGADTAGAGRDSLEAEIARELEMDSLRAPPAPGAPPAAPPGGPAPVYQGAPQSLNPDISVIGDFLADLSPDESTLEEMDRFQVREVELGFQAAVDPYFRADFFIALKGEEIELEEGFLTTLSLPHGLQAKAGRFHLPFGKVNLTHRPELRTIEYPRVVQEFFGDDGFASAGLWVSKIFSPFGFYQELIGVVGNDLGHGIRERGEAAAGNVEGGEPGELGEEDDDADDDRDLLDDLGDRLFLGHLKSYVDLSEAANLEVGLSAATGEDQPGDPLAERLTFYGANAIYRWRPPAQGLYRSLVLQAEATWREGDERTDFGAFLFGQLQVGRRWYVGARIDRVEAPEGVPDERETSLSAYMTLFPSEFSLFRLGYEHRGLKLAEDVDRLLVQAVVTLGPHRPHPF